MLLNRPGEGEHAQVKRLRCLYYVLGPLFFERTDFQRYMVNFGGCLTKG